ncbi:hypothetical protein GWN42_13575 [candidate division KSB1 bacterium]|nr:hypothetical protein [candidate division KSB1 bacterium]
MRTIPLTPEPDYSEIVEIESQTVELSVRWNLLDEGWYLDIVGQTFELELLGLKLVGGVNLLKPFAVLELGGLFLLDTEEKFEDPDFDLIGDRFILIYVTKAEMVAITI